MSPRRFPRRRMGAAALLLLLAGTTSASAQPIPTHIEPANVDVRTWADSPRSHEPDEPEIAGALLSPASAASLLAISAVGSAALAMRAGRKEA